MAPPVDEQRPSPALLQRLDRMQNVALLVGGAGLGLCLLAGLIWPRPFFPSYLIAFLFWSGIALGCEGITMLHHLVGGQWGKPVRRPMEAAAMTLFPLAVLFLPIVLGLARLYPWARPEEVQHDPELLRKSVYLNETFFVGRAALYFAVWIVLALILGRYSRKQDETSSTAPSRVLQALSGPGLVLLFLTASFAAIDWGMSLEPKWASTIYGAMLVTGQALSTLAFMLILLISLSDDTVVREAASPSRLHDLGNLTLAFVMLWAYMAFSQFLIVWAGDLSDETPWYLRRTHGGWQWVALVLIGFHFFLPFFVLLFKETKEQARLLYRVACLIIAMHLVDLTWLVIPATAEAAGPSILWEYVPMILAATAGIGGIWLATFFWRWKAGPLFAVHEVHLSSSHAGRGGE